MIDHSLLNPTLTVDELAAGIFQQCSVGLGLCRRNGLTLCRDGALACGATPGEPTDEVCDSQDNDCDGFIDEEAERVGEAPRRGRVG